jgi:hypothetical protein
MSILVCCDSDDDKNVCGNLSEGDVVYAMISLVTRVNMVIPALMVILVIFFFRAEIYPDFYILSFFILDGI